MKPTDLADMAPVNPPEWFRGSEPLEPIATYANRVGVRARDILQAAKASELKAKQRNYPGWGSTAVLTDQQWCRAMELQIQRDRAEGRTV